MIDEKQPQFTPFYWEGPIYTEGEGWLVTLVIDNKPHYGTGDTWREAVYDATEIIQRCIFNHED